MNLCNNVIPFGKRDPKEQRRRRREIKNEMDHYKIRIKKRKPIKDPISLSKYNELEFEALSRYTKRCEDFSSLESANDPIRVRSMSIDTQNEEENDNQNTQEMIKFIKKNSQDSYPPKFKKYKTGAPSFTMSYHDRVSKHIYPLPVSKSHKTYSIPKIDTKLPDDSITKKKMKKYLMDNGETLTSYMK